MSRTKVIYFLSAFVLIIGCFALNKSYSLFVDTKEEQVLSSTVPVLNGDLSLASVTVEGTEEGSTEPSTVLVKQTVTNTGNVTMNYAINAHSASTYSLRSVQTYEVSAATDGTNTYYSTGTLPAGESVDLYFAIENTSIDPVALNFSIEKNYETISEELETNINNDEPYMVNVGIPDLPYVDKPNSLAGNIIINYVSSKGVANSIEEMFSENSQIVTLSDVSELFPSPTEFTDIEKNEVGLYKAEDDYGMSYYFRGASSVNYVNFAGFTWRIVRINGDGSVRLVLDGTLDKFIKDQPIIFNSNSYRDNAYIGYMFGNSGNKDYKSTHQNINESEIKIYIDDFYENYLLSYQGYLADTLFCGDKTRASGYTKLGFGTNTTYYSAYDRLYKTSVANPTFRCASSEIDTDVNLTEEERSYSRYTSKINLETTTSNGILLNNDLTYPIALLSADELVMAGAFRDVENESYYLYDSYLEDTLYFDWWTMSPMSYESGAYMFFSSAAVYSLYYLSDVDLGVRPVININLDAIVASGDGTKDTSVGEGPYTLTLNS